MVTYMLKKYRNLKNLYMAYNIKWQFFIAHGYET